MCLAMREGKLSSVKVNMSGPQLSHLLFSDYCVLLGEATLEGTIVLRNIL